MTEQERPRTEAGPLMQGTVEEAEMIDRPSTQEGKDLLFMLGTHDPDDLNMVARVLAIEEAARTEGRQQAVREIRERLGYWGTAELVNPDNSGHVLAYFEGDVIEALDRVAGLNRRQNASEHAPESPLTETYTDDAGSSHTSDQCRWEPSRIYRGSEACLVNPVAHYRDASESGQPLAPVSEYDDGIRTVPAIAVKIDHTLDDLLREDADREQLWPLIYEYGHAAAGRAVQDGRVQDGRAHDDGLPSRFMENVAEARENGYDRLCAHCGVGVYDESDMHDRGCPEYVEVPR